MGAERMAAVSPVMRPARIAFHHELGQPARPKTPAIAFAGVAAIIGALAGVFGRAGWPNSWWKAILAGLITGLIAAILSAPIATYVFGGVMGSGTDVIVAMARSVGLDSLGANIAQGTFSDPMDKMASYLLVYLVLRALPLRFLARFSNLAPRSK